MWGHSGAPFKNFIYLFHMAIFFMASGYLWNDKNVESFTRCGSYIWKKIKSLWIPFFVGNGMLTLCNNLFLRMGIYTNNSEFLTLNIGEYDQLTSYIGFKTALGRVLKNLLFTGAPQLGGATWFLRTLFVVSVAHMVFRYIATHFKFGKQIYVVCGILAVMFAQIFTMYDISLPLTSLYKLHTCFAAYVAFLMGLLIKKYDVMGRLLKQKLVIAWLLSFVVLVGLNFIGSISMSTSDITNVVYFVIASFAGWIFLWGISTALRSLIMGKAIGYCGQHSLWILILHFLSFKVVSYIYVWITGKSILYVACYPTINDVVGLWIPYIFAGVTVPLILEWIIKYGIKRIQTTLPSRA